MKWLGSFLVVFLILVALTPVALGQETRPRKINYPLKIASKDTSTLHRKQLTFFPVIYRSPETGLAYGMLALGLFKMIGVKDSMTRTSNVELPIILTAQKQFVVDLVYNLITNKERFFIRGFNQYNNFSEYYYGIGNNTPDTYRTFVKYQSFRTNQRIVARINKRHFVGVQYQYYKVSNTSFLDTLLYNPQNNRLGYGGFTTAGLGLVYLYDSRNNVINSRTGTYFEISTLVCSPSLGSQYQFNNITVDARKFIPLGKGKVLALQGLLNHNQGDVPWRQMAAMGGFSMMRGYYLGRHRDKNYAAFQAEYRVHIWKFFGMTFFGATGAVAPELEKIAPAQLKFAGGTGLRFQVDKKERVNIRFDMGFGGGQPGYYLTIGEAF
jgi:outer membrane protein assembly factor BamA